MAPRTVTRDELAPVARAALGKGLTSVTRLAGGSRKGVYRLTMDDESTAVLYSWEAAENFWPDADGDADLRDPFTAGIGLDLFEAAYARLKSLGLRVPEVHLIDHGRNLMVLEDFPGENLMDRLARDPAGVESTMARLAEGLAAMRAYRAPTYGRVALVDNGGTSLWPTCAEAALDFGLRCLAEAAGRDRRIGDVRDRLEGRLRELAAAVRPRSEFSVVHGELGLDHVLVDAAGAPVIIDIEDLMYFDVEWEHVFLRIRLGRDYERLDVDGLDDDRMALYMLVQRLSLTAGPLRLLDGDFPHRAFMRHVAEVNLNAALSHLDPGTHDDRAVAR